MEVAKLTPDEVMVPYVCSKGLEANTSAGAIATAVAKAVDPVSKEDGGNWTRDSTLTLPAVMPTMVTVMSSCVASLPAPPGLAR
jgi:hypothetical protein